MPASLDPTSHRGSSLRAIVVAILLVAATATAMDWYWYAFGVRHRVWTGVVHGAVLLTVVGGALGALGGRGLRGLPIGAIAGIGGALSYYLIAAAIDRRPYGVAIPVAWIVLWLLMAVLEGRWLSAPQRRSWREVATRGVLAAVTGGIAFFLVVGTLWGTPPPSGRNYLVQLAAWAFAWAPGMLALTVGARASARSAATS
jgi:hypothetical protein